MGSGASKPEWYPGEPTTTADEFDECSCEPVCLGSHGGATTTATSSSFSSREKSGSASSIVTERREITSLPVVKLTDMEFIANGAYCSVFSCKYRGWSVVAKRVRADLPLTERREALANLWTEYDCLRPLNHPNVIDVYGMCRVKCRDDYCDWNEKDVCLLLERLALGTVGHLFGTTYDIEKNLATTLARSRKMKMVPFRCRLDRALELALALEYVHEGAGIGTIMHRDIKSVNVGFALNGNLKLMDFGLSKVIAPHGAPENDTYQMTGEVGSYRYMAPELVRHEPYNAKADIYSWAILSWEVLAVSRPYAGITETSFIKKVVIDGHRPKLLKSWPERLRTLLASAWHANFSKRPTAAQIVSVLEDIKAELSQREQRRPSQNAPSLSNTSRSRRNSRQQRSVSAPGSMCYARRSIVPSSSVGDAGGVGDIGNGGGGSGGGSGGSGGGVSPTTPAKKRFSFPMSRASPAAKRRWSFVGRSSTPRQTLGTSRISNISESKSKTILPPPPALSLTLTSMPTTDEDEDGCPRPHPDGTSLPCRRYHQEATSQRVIIADALAQEAEGARLEATARQEAAARSANHPRQTAGEGRFAVRDRLYAEREAHTVREKEFRAYLGEGEGEGNSAGPRSAGVDGIADVALDFSQKTTEEMPDRARCQRSSQDVMEETPARARHCSSQETAEEVSGRACRDSSLETTTEDAPARGRRHSSSQETEDGVPAHARRNSGCQQTAEGDGVGMSRGSSLSKLWPSKSNRSIETEESSKSWSFRVGLTRSAGEPYAASTLVLSGENRVSRTKSAGEPYAASTLVLGSENGGDGDRPAANSMDSSADRPTAPIAATVVRDMGRIERPVKRSKNPRAYVQNGYNPLERAPL